MTAPGDHAATPAPWYRRLLSSDAFRRTARTFLQAFLGLLLPGLLGWLHALTEWAQAEGQAPLPDAGSLAYLGVAAIAAGFVAAVTAIMTGVEDATGRGLLRNPRAEAGTGNTRTIAVLALGIAVLVLLVVLL